MIETETMDGIECLKGLQGGDFPFNFTSDLKEILKGVKETGRPGKLTLTITIDPKPDLGYGAHIITPKIDCKIPKSKEEGSIRFITDQFALSEMDPRQLRFSDLKTKINKE